MNKTRLLPAHNENQVTWNSEQLPEKLGCGICTARKIGEAAGAKIVIGKRVLWNASKIQAYLDNLAEQGGCM